MDVGFNVGLEAKFGSEDGNIVIDNHVDLLNVDPSRDDIGRDEHLCLAVPERIEDFVSFASLLVTVERGDRMTFRG